MDTDAVADGPSVVVPAIRVPSTVACLRSLGAAGIDTIVVSESPRRAGFYSNYCDEGLLVPDPDEDLLAYRDALLDLAARPDVRTIVPVREADVYLLARYRSAFEKRISLAVPPLTTLERVHDRVQLAAAADAADVPYPNTRPLSTVEDWSDEQLVKSRYNLLTSAYLDAIEPGDGIEVEGQVHLEPGESANVADLRSAMSHDPIVQEFVRGEEYMVGALSDHGDPLATVQHHQVRGMSYVGAGGVYRESVAIPALEDAAHRLLVELDWHGPACLEYVCDERTGAFTLLEVNPRMWQSLEANVRMGVDFPYHFWLLATGRADEIEATYDPGVGCQWLKGEFLHLLSLFRHESSLSDRPSAIDTVRDVAATAIRNRTFDYLSLDDPGPFIQDWWELFCAIPDVPELTLPGADVREWERSADVDAQQSTRERPPKQLDD